MPDFAAVLVVDRRGWLLLQERDEHAPLNADQWGLVGGHVEDGEAFEAAARRELHEETGLSPDVPLTHWQDFAVPARAGDDDGTMAVFAAALDVDDGDIVLGEGRQIVFCDPSTMADRDIRDIAERVVTAFLQSELYAIMTP